VKGTASVTTSRTVSVVGSFPPTLFVTAEPEKIYLNAGETTPVKLKATNAAGVGVAGVELALDENLMGYGSVDKTTGTTDANGEVTITWTAPAATILNKHVESRLSVAPTATATYPASSTSTVTQFLVLKNMAPSSWHLVKVVGATMFACNETNKTTEVTVMAMDAQGNALPSEPLALTYSNAAALNAPPTTVTTNATGYAVATITWADGIDTNATQVFFKNPNVPNAVGAGASLLYKGASVPTEPMYGGYSTVNVAAFLDPDTADELTVDIFLYDLDGNAAAGDVPVALIVGEPSDGSCAALVDAPDYIYTSLTDYAGINMFTSADKGSVTTGGYFLSTLMTDAEIDALNENYANWTSLMDAYWTSVDVANMKPLTVTDGHATIKIAEDNVFLADTVPSIFVAPMAKAGFYVTADEGNFWWEVHAPTAFKMDLVMQRTMTLASAKYTVSTGILKDFAPSNVANVEMWLYDQDNAPMVGESAALYGGNLFTYTTAGVTDATGKTTGTVTTKPTVTTPQRQPIYVAPDIAGRGTTFASFEMFNIPMQLYALLTVAPTVQQGPATATVTAKVVDETGTGVADLLVTFANEGGSLSSPNATTDTNGEGTVTYTLPEVEAGETKAFGEVSMQALKPGHGAAATSYTVVTYNLPPVIKDLSINDTGYETYNKDVTVAGKATDVQGLAFLRAVLDSGAPVNVTVGTGGAFAHAMINLSIGAHTVVFTAEDVKGLTTTHTVAFTVKENVAPAITDLSKADGFKTKDTAFTLTGKVSDTDGVKSVKIAVDGGAPVTLTVTNGSWSYDFKDLKVGKHSAVVTVEDNFGQTATKTLNFEVEEEGAGGGSTWLILIIVIIIILVIIVLVMMMMRKKPKEAPKAEETK
jgi:protocatechuate 3,4-dioxygenase beta subunit